MDTPEAPRRRCVVTTQMPASSMMDRSGTRGRQMWANLPEDHEDPMRDRMRQRILQVMRQVRVKFPTMGISSLQGLQLREQTRREIESLLTEQE
ncbi:MAG: hypothetical protein V3S71_08390 [Acidobacteriota bacterium]